MKKLGILIGLGLFFLFVVAGLPGHSVAKETLKIGLNGPLSGPGMPWGVGLQTVLEIACDDINSKGGLKVGNKVYEPKIIPYDDKYNPEAAFTSVNRLVYEDKVKYIFGPFSSAGSLAVQVVTEKEKVLIFCLPFTSKFLAPQKPFSFRIVATPVEYSYLESVWMAKNRNIKSAVILGPNDETGREGVRFNREGYEKAGIKILSEDYYERGAPDMLPLVTRVMRYNPDLLEFNGGAPGDVVNIAKVARAQGYKKFMSKLGGGGNICYAAAPEALEGFLFHMEGDTEGATGKFRDLIKEMQKRKPQIPVDSGSGNFYSVFLMLMKAMQDEGTVEDSNAVRMALQRIDDFDGIHGGKLGWEGKDNYGINNQLKGPLYLAEGVGGKIKIIAKIR